MTLKIFIVGSVITLALAGLLWIHRDKVAAALVVLWSPFPCPPGVPC